MDALPEILHRTDRLTLRPLRPEDERPFVRTVDESAEVWRPWLPAGRSDRTPSDHFLRELERTRAGARHGTHLRLGAFDAEGSLAGLFALNEIARGVFQSAYASWQVGVRHMGRGLATEGVRGLLDIAFRDPPHGLALHRVQANVMPANGASLRVADKVGFRREGLALRYLEIAGAWEDHVMLAITSEEWDDGAD